MTFAKRGNDHVYVLHQKQNILYDTLRSGENRGQCTATFSALFMLSK